MVLIRGGEKTIGSLLKFLGYFYSLKKEEKKGMKRIDRIGEIGAQKKGVVFERCELRSPEMHPKDPMSRNEPVSRVFWPSTPRGGGVGPRQDAHPWCCGPPGRGARWGP